MNPITMLLLEDSDDDYILAVSSVSKDKLYNGMYRVKDGVEGLQFLNKEPGGFADGPDGAQIPFEDAPTPDVLIVDLNMPRMDGREFTARVKADKKHRKIPVIVLTSSKDEKDVSEIYDTGAAAYIVKPINVKEMGYVVKEIADFYMSVVRLPGRE